MTETEAARLLGKKGGLKGGKSKSPSKLAAIAKNLEAARLKRWPSKTTVVVEK